MLTADARTTLAYSETLFGLITFEVTDNAGLGSSCTCGGWRSFGVFKNQGDCVSFVATGGKNRPASRRESS